jgi:hypothetical protein
MTVRGVPMIPPSTYADAEVRGRLRQWKADLSRSYRIVDHLLAKQSAAVVADLRAFCFRGSSTGRQRAFSRISRMLASAGATLEGVRREGKAPIAVWSILKPRESVTFKPDDASDAQNCISVNYVVIGRLVNEETRWGDGLWTLEIPDHALGRLLHRSANDPAGSITDAHHAALRLRREDVLHNGKIDRNVQFLLPAGPGAFVCSATAGADVSPSSVPGMHVRAHTWLSDDMLRDDQTPLIGDGGPGERLGDDWLLPAPLRLTTTDSAGMLTQIGVWAPGMPTLTNPRGRAGHG